MASKFVYESDSAIPLVFVTHCKRANSKTSVGGLQKTMVIEKGRRALQSPWDVCIELVTLTEPFLGFDHSARLIATPTKRGPRGMGACQQLVNNVLDDSDMCHDFAGVSCSAAA